MLNHESPSHAQIFAKRLTENVSQVIVGGRQAIEQSIIGLLCQGHLLIEDVPGVGKTMLARSLARTLGCSFARIQFTPDILPSEITGVHTFNKASRTYEYRPGPIMAQILLIDEINRAAPRAQAALLEAMEERQITVGKAKYALPNPFIVLATENLIESQGTFPLPKSQLDRFFLRIQLGYPSPEEEIIVLDRQKLRHPIADLKQTISIAELFNAQAAIKMVYVSPMIERYIVDIIEQTRRHPDVFLGGSPRASLVLYRGSQACAAIYGRSFTLPDDVKALVLPALSHRIMLSPGAHLRKLTTADILGEILERTPITSKIETGHMQRVGFSIRNLNPFPVRIAR